MSADELRRAATTLRERVEGATLASGDGAWSFTDIGWNDVQGTTYTIKAGYAPVAEAGCEEQAIYIATMHPGVGLWLASLLGMMADHALGRGSVCGSCVEYSEALARLINGGA